MLMLVPPTQQDDKDPRLPARPDLHHRYVGIHGRAVDRAGESSSSCGAHAADHRRIDSTSSNSTTAVRSLFPTPQPVTTRTSQQAIHYTEHLTADGGTEVLPALRQALKSPQDSSRLQQIILLTDGQVGNEEELFELLHHRVGNRRLFTIGIGSTPNSHLDAEDGRIRPWDVHLYRQCE